MATRKRRGEDEFGMAPRHGAARRWTDPPVLLALIAVMVGAVAAIPLLRPAAPRGASADVGFTRDMIVHHDQAVEMANTVRDRTQDPALRALASEITLFQQLQVGMMRGWLDVWGLSAAPDGPRMAWMDHPVDNFLAMPGMASQADLRRLEELPVPEMEALFLRLTILHHQGGVDMARAALERAGRKEVRNLAQAVVNTQTAEVALMQSYLQRRGLPPVSEQELAAVRVGAGAAASGMASGMAHDMGAGGAAMSGGGDGEGFAAGFADVAGETLRYLPILLAVVGAGWLGFDFVQRRRMGASAAIGPWQVVAAGALLVTAALHLGLTPEHFQERTAFGVFFLISGVMLAVVAAAVLAWPVRPVFVAGAALSLTLIVLWALFRLVPPPGESAAEAIDLVGVVTKVAEVIALGACVALWRAPAWAIPTRTTRPRQVTPSPTAEPI